MRNQDLRIETILPDDYSKGGQHVGVITSRVKVTHVPTGLSASCGTERSHSRSLRIARSMLEYGLAELGWEDGCDVKVGPRDWLKAKHDTRPGRGLWAPGEYLCACVQCSDPFIGDKRAGHCADCAYSTEWGGL